jgi:N-acetylneuraminic acid mutarotase
MYIFNPNLIPNSVRGRYFLKFDLINHAYIDPSSYDFALPSGEIYYTCVAYNPKLNVFYNMGGTNWNLNVAYNYLQTYNLTADEWSPMNALATLPLAVMEAGCAMDADNENVYVFGGRNDAWTIYDRIQLE